MIQVLQEAIAISRSTGDKLILGYNLEIYSGVVFAKSNGQEQPK